MHSGNRKEATGSYCPLQTQRLQPNPELRSVCRGRKQCLLRKEAENLKFNRERTLNLNNPEIRTVDVTLYITPLREGGSLPAIVEADDDFMYVLKFRGAGQGIKALIAELVAGELARVLGFRLPEIVFVNLHEAFGRT